MDDTLTTFDGPPIAVAGPQWISRKIFKTRKWRRACSWVYHQRRETWSTQMRDQTIIRPEQPDDIDAIRRVNELAFGAPAEAKLVDALRNANAVLLSLVAEIDRQIVGHILFSPVQIERGNTHDDGVGLGPVAVLPAVQRCGIGKMLVQAGIEKIRVAGHGVIVVLGHPSYYPRFGFKSASEFDLRWEVPGHEEAFFALELRPSFLGVRPGTVLYRPEFTQS